MAAPPHNSTNSLAPLRPKDDADGPYNFSPTNWRRVSVRELKTQRDWAEEMAHLLDIDFPDAEVVVLVMDNLL